MKMHGLPSAENRTVSEIVDFSPIIEKGPHYIVTSMRLGNPFPPTVVMMPVLASTRRIPRMICHDSEAYADAVKTIARKTKSGFR